VIELADATNLPLMIETFAVSSFSKRQILPECVFVSSSAAIVLSRSVIHSAASRSS
jgi:hypothetical protein